MERRFIDNVKKNTEVIVLWTNTRGKKEWYSGIVKKVHRYDNHYVVCHVEYEDGDEDKSTILKENEYGSDWYIPQQKTPAPLPCQDTEVLSGIQRMNRTLVAIALAQYFFVGFFAFIVYASISKSYTYA
jgi:hypothetical protein